MIRSLIVCTPWVSRPRDCRLVTSEVKRIVQRGTHRDYAVGRVTANRAGLWAESFMRQPAGIGA